MKQAVLILLLILFTACEETVIVGLPPAQNLVVVEGKVTNFNEIQQIRLTQSNGFSDEVPIVPITDASIVVQTRTGITFLFSHTSEGFYLSDVPFAGAVGLEYRVRIQLNDGQEIRSDWEEMPDIVEINSTTVESFLENDPNNPNQQITIYYPKINAIDPVNIQNFYRWVFYKDGERFNEPETITIQDDRFFDGNLVPNNFQAFEYELGDEIIVQFQSITQESFDYLRLIQSQITTLGTSAGTTPAIINGNLAFEADENQSQVLGYFSVVSISADTVIVE